MSRFGFFFAVVAAMGAAVGTAAGIAGLCSREGADAGALPPKVSPKGSAAAFAEAIFRVVDGFAVGADFLSVQSRAADGTEDFTLLRDASALRAAFVERRAAFYAEMCGVLVPKGALRTVFHTDSLLTDFRSEGGVFGRKHFRLSYYTTLPRECQYFYKNSRKKSPRLLEGGGSPRVLF